MTSALADSFLKDLDASSSSEEGYESVTGANDEQQTSSLNEIAGGVETDTKRDSRYDLVECVEQNDAEKQTKGNGKSEITIGKSLLLEDEEFIKKIESLKDATVAGDIENTMNRLQDVNNSLMLIDAEILRLFQLCRETYGRRFPELEALIPTPLDYLFVMRKLGNDLNIVNDVSLNEHLSNSAILAVTVAASVSVGRNLSDDSIEKIMKAAADVDNLVELRFVSVEFIEKAMAIAAPNLTAILGFSLAARLVAHSGGLANLAKMPSQNLLVVGGSSYARRTAAITAKGGDPSLLPQLARNAGKGYGVIYECDLVQSTLPNYRSKAMRLVGGKAALAVRRDVYKNDGTNTIGKIYRQLIVEKLKKIQAPPPARLKKPLPIPEEQQRARRGGRRKRRWKEKYGMTEVRKKANRLHVTIETAGEPDHMQEDDDDDDDVF